MTLPVEKAWVVLWWWWVWEPRNLIVTVFEVVLAPAVPLEGKQYAGRGTISITTENIFGFLILWLQLFYNG